jgi:hypothetical protein
MEFACGRDVLWSGPWTLEVHCGGVLAVPTGRWEEVCWVSDDEANYLELEMRFSGGLRVQRQMLLARRDRFLMLADVILGRGAGPTTYRGCLPLAEGVDWRGGSETREGVIAGPSRCLRGLPLALPEWQATPAGGQSRRTPQGLELWQSTEAARLLAPWFLDFDQRRSGRPLTWRQLTVAENRASVPRHQAAGFRVMIGAQQWLIYRARGGRGNRTLLGHNLSSEMLVGRFNRRGEVKPLVEVE